jgi:hypothetical protein
MLGAQQELYSSKYMRKAECKNAAEIFVLNYGWKIN